MSNDDGIVTDELYRDNDGQPMANPDGYHWWSSNREAQEISPEDWRHIIEDVRKLVDNFAYPLTSGDGKTGRPVIDGEKILFNGMAPNAGEPFHFTRKGEPPDTCATGLFYYDAAVFAVLAVIASHYPSLRHIETLYGNRDEHRGFALAWSSRVLDRHISLPNAGPLLGSIPARHSPNAVREKEDSLTMEEWRPGGSVSAVLWTNGETPPVFALMFGTYTHAEGPATSVRHFTLSQMKRLGSWITRRLTALEATRPAVLAAGSKPSEPPV